MRSWFGPPVRLQRPMPRISTRVAQIQESKTLAITMKAKALKAEGTSVIDFGVGEPDFPTPDHVVAAAARACAEPALHKYSPTGGLPELRAAVAGAFALAGENVLITNGAKQAVLMSLAVTVDPGDEVLVPAPYWVTYPEAVRLSGGLPVPVPWDSGFKVTPELLETRLGRRTKALILGSPSNPTGVVYRADELEALARWAGEHGVWIISDEIYRDLVYPPATFRSIADFSDPDLTLLVGGVSKTYAMTGWRVGWLIGPRDAVRAGVNLQSHMTSHVNNVAQVAALAALEGEQATVSLMATTFDRRRRMMVEGIRELRGFSLTEPQGAFYAFPDVSAVLGTALEEDVPQTDQQLAEVILDREAVAVVPGSAFGAPGHLRLAYALADEDVAEGLERLKRLFG